MNSSTTPFSPAADRNKHAILDGLRQLLPTSGRALEVASGTGQHVAWFAAQLPQWQWQPTDAEAAGFAGIAAHCAGLANVRPALLLDLLQSPWLPTPQPSPENPANDFFGAPLDLIYCANMLHIAPWACCAALMQGSAQRLAPGGRLVTYGPYLQNGVPTAAGNLAFDASLRQRNSAWGVRALEDVVHEAQRAGLQLQALHSMPANNLLLVWGRAV